MRSGFSLERAVEREGVDAHVVKSLPVARVLRASPRPQTFLGLTTTVTGDAEPRGWVRLGQSFR